MLDRPPRASPGRFQALANLRPDRVFRQGVNMKTPSAYLMIAALLVAAAGVFAYRTYRGDAEEPGVAGGLPAAGRGPARVLLNEILFASPDGQPQWVELVNVGGDAVALAGFTLENHAQERYAFPDSVTMPAGGVLLVRFDGQTGNEPGTVHAAATTFLAPDGFIVLSGSQGAVDRIAWGDRQFGAANLSRGGHHDDVPSGTSLGRVARMITSDPLEWVSYAPQQTTPGQANPQPSVEILLPMDGAILTGAVGPLTWYPVAGAVRHHVQLAADASFAAPLLDQTVPEPQVTGPELARGSYVWRVQASRSTPVATRWLMTGGPSVPMAIEV